MDIGETRECSLPPPLTEDEISSAVDGRPTRHARAHLRRCAFCSERVAEARRVESALSGALYRFDCPPAQRLIDYALTLLDDAEAQAIALHLARCSRCATEVSELSVLVEAQSFEGQPLAEETISAAARPHRIRLPRVAFDDIVARLTPRSPALAYRGATAGREPIVAVTGDIVISVDLRPTATGQVEVTGILATLEPAQWVGAVALLRLEGEVRAAATLDENGGFAFEQVPPGIATLRIIPEVGPHVVIAEFHLA